MGFGVIVYMDVNFMLGAGFDVVWWLVWVGWVGNARRDIAKRMFGWCLDIVWNA